MRYPSHAPPPLGTASGARDQVSGICGRERKTIMDAATKLVEEVKSSPTVEVKKDVAESYSWLPCQLSLDILIVNFTVGDLLRLGKELVVETGCPSTSDIPLRANGLLIAWSEFEVIGNRLALRITELA